LRAPSLNRSCQAQNRLQAKDLRRRQTRRGKTIGRSSLYALLSNRTYVGETVHKGASYKGEHKAIVPCALFDAVQKQLTELGPALSGKARTDQDSTYANLVFDDTSAPMLPTYSAFATVTT